MAKNKSYDEEAVRELKLFEENDYQLYKQSKTPIYQNLEKKQKKGVYDSKKAEKLFKIHADRAAQKYTKEYGTKGNSSYGVFSVGDREQLAKELRDEFEEESNIEKK